MARVTADHMIDDTRKFRMDGCDGNTNSCYWVAGLGFDMKASGRFLRRGANLDQAVTEPWMGRRLLHFFTEINARWVWRARERRMLVDGLIQRGRSMEKHNTKGWRELADLGSPRTAKMDAPTTFRTTKAKLFSNLASIKSMNPFILHDELTASHANGSFRS